jgi:hypothetical protein
MKGEKIDGMTIFKNNDGKDGWVSGSFIRNCSKWGVWGRHYQDTKLNH